MLDWPNLTWETSILFTSAFETRAPRLVYSNTCGLNPRPHGL